MSQTTFYLLEQDNINEQPAPLALACQLAANCFSNKQPALIYCADQQQAEQMDELLWQLPAERFVPHNLTGEGPANGTPVEICWQPPGRGRGKVLINLHPEKPTFSQGFAQVFDFVPADEQQKQQARERYKHYRAAGDHMDTRPANSLESVSE